VHAITGALFHTFLSPAGIVVLGAIDSSILFTAPFALDFAVIIMTARHRDTFWLFPLLAAIGSLVGAAITFWIGQRIGEEGLDRFIPRQRLDRVLRRGRTAGLVALALLALVPPPFPFTAVVLAAGAIKLDAVRFLTAVAAVKCVRYGAEASLALLYGSHIVTWIESDIAEAIGASIALLVIVGAAWSTWRLLRRRGGTGANAGAGAERQG
jgi:membrane protein YqaA with SNARE-associated domain